MVLSRSKQTIQEECTGLGVSFQQTVQLLLDLSKGRIAPFAGKWFYSLFLTQTHVPTTIEGVRDKLRAAWWVEEKDVKQELLMCVWRLGLTSKSDLKYTLGRNIKDWLIKQRVFSRQSGWEREYLEEQKEYVELQRKVGLPMVFQANPLDICPFSLFNRYLMYLSYILKLPRPEIKRVMLSHERQINRFQTVLKEQMEECNGR